MELISRKYFPTHIYLSLWFMFCEACCLLHMMKLIQIKIRGWKLSDGKILIKKQKHEMPSLSNFGILIGFSRSYWARAEVLKVDLKNKDLNSRQWFSTFVLSWEFQENIEFVILSIKLKEESQKSKKLAITGSRYFSLIIQNHWSAVKWDFICTQVAIFSRFPVNRNCTFPFQT